MAYVTRRRGKRSFTRRKRYSQATNPPGYTGRARPPRRRRYTKRRSTVMSKKRLLNVVSQKKRDTMLTYTNMTSASQAGGTTYAADVPAIITGGLSVNQCTAILWCATARDNTTSNANARGTKFDVATRTSSTPYMIGLKEAIEIQVSTGMPWQWRRICFTAKGTIGLTYDTTFAVSTETSNGYVRVVNALTGNPGGLQQYALFERIFRGQNTADWNDPMTAKTDNQRVTIKYDKTTSLASGNEDGFIRKYNRWHDMHKTLVYNDDELGGGENVSSFSTQGKGGMGDYYVLDLFRARTGATNSDQLSFRPESTLYWHER
ncbi:MAG: capsid protein [Gemycircularvirus mouti6]|uniref:capsid protein n=1 Tax=Genomoviridae sp. TaxID=2202565 RepID=UPI0024820F17|nr:MAG: capsid protein [Genomoviridae sp.]QCW23692.1 MAG: capsid protein [Genomoviridae sp.]